jgi:hypothetical protein
MKSAFTVSLDMDGFEHQCNKNLKLGKFNTEDNLRSLKLNFRCQITLKSVPLCIPTYEDRIHNAMRC